MRVAIYARYSSDRQNERSIADQTALARRHAASRGWSVVAEFADAAISGSAMANRPGLTALLAAAEAQAFDAVLVEDTDRLARNREHDAHVYNRLTHAGVSIATFTSEKVTVIESALKGLMNELYIVQLSEKTRRGMASNAERGLATGSRLYGYRSQPGGALAIVAEEAAVVREIFARFAAGETVRAIAFDLNRRRVPGPRGGLWAPSTLAGNKARGSGLFECELYVGVKVWNRVEMRKDPQTGRRLSRPRPQSEWKRTPAPQLAILEAATWAAVRARRARVATAAPFARRRARPGIFSGLIRCAECGAAMTAFNGRGKLACRARREQGPGVCTNDRSVSRDHVEARVLAGLRARLLSPEAVKAYVRAYHHAWQAEQAASSAAIAPMRRRLGELSRAIERLVDRICEGTDTPQTNQRLKDLEAEKAELVRGLADAEKAAPPPLTLHPRAAEQYAARVAELQAALAAQAGLAEPTWAEAIDKARALIDHIDVRAIGYEENARVMVTLHGTLAALLKAEAGHPQPRLYKVVAGARSGLMQTPPPLRIAC